MIRTIVISAAGALALLVTLSMGCMGVEQINTGHRGVQVVFGEVNEQKGSLPEGLYFFNPITTSMIEMDTRTIRWEGKTNTYTKDVQQADIVFVANYRLDATKAHTVFKNVGADWGEKVVGQAIIGPLKQIIGHYEAVDLIENRGRATSEVHAAVAEALKSVNVVLERIELVNIQYHKEFEKSVEDKVVAVQRAVQERNKTVQVQEQAKQAVIAATAQAQSMKIRADALQANAKLVEYEAVQKWDGKLPMYSLGGATPFINLTPGK
jgi:prohibitin 2